MGKVIVDVSVSLDGFMAGPNVAADNPMGDGGERLHQWLFDPDAGEADAALARQITQRVGAVVVGRRTFDVGYEAWDRQTPFPAPTFVVTHRPRPALPTQAGTFEFVADGVASAVRQAYAVAGGKDIAVMGCEVTREMLGLGLVDELHFHLVPVLLGGGLRLFDLPGRGLVEFDLVDTIASARVTHLKYRLP